MYTHEYQILVTSFSKKFEDKYFQGSVNIREILDNFYPQKYVTLSYLLCT